MNSDVAVLVEVLAQQVIGVLVRAALPRAFRDVEVVLRSEVRLTPYYAVRYVDMSSTVGDQGRGARAAPVEAPAYGPTGMGVDGDFGGAVITVFATVMTDLSSALTSTGSSAATRSASARGLSAVLHLAARQQLECPWSAGRRPSLNCPVSDR